MSNISIIATTLVTEADLPAAQLGQQLGPRFGRLDLQSQLALLAVASLKIDFSGWARNRVGIVLAATAGSLTTDANFWIGHDSVGGPSPTLFAYTLPSAALGEIAIHFGLTGPNLCLVGGEKNLLPEAGDLLWRGEADGCVCVLCGVISSAVAKIISAPPAAFAGALFMQKSGGTGEVCEIQQWDARALEALMPKLKPKS
jgi:hypothetical protein